jgi:hypothetical protein
MVRYYFDLTIWDLGQTELQRSAGGRATSGARFCRTFLVVVVGGGRRDEGVCSYGGDRGPLLKFLVQYSSWKGSAGVQAQRAPGVISTV